MGTELGQGLTVRLQPDQAIGSEELDRLAGRLRRELLELDVDDVRRATGGEAPEGARALDAHSVGTLLVSLVTAPEALRAVVGVIRGWLGRSQARSVFLEIDGDVLHVTGLSSADQERLIEDWLSRRGGS
jgi:hypothetical protein